MKHTPLPWFVRKLERDGQLIDCFVAAKDFNGFGHDAEILGDDEYREGVERKLADSDFIVEACNNYERVKAERDDLLGTLGDLAFWVENELPHIKRYPALLTSVHTLEQRAVQARAAIAKARGEK